jgi:arsenate reductase
MAHGFLQSFDNRLKVYSAGTEASGKVNPNAIRVMREAGVDISHHTSESVGLYLGMEWDYVITVCGGANENCPVFSGSVRHRIHMGYDDPSDATGTEEFISGEYIRVRNEIRVGFRKLFEEELKQQL